MSLKFRYGEFPEIVCWLGGDRYQRICHWENGVRHDTDFGLWLLFLKDEELMPMVRKAEEEMRTTEDNKG